MALTLKGNRTGRAAAIERQERLQEMNEAYWEERRRIIEKNKADFGNALDILKQADPDGWEAWYDDDANIPPLIRWTDRAQIDELIRRMLERAREVAQQEEK